MASSKDRQRKLARAKLDRQMARRAAALRRKRQIQAGIGAALALLLIVFGSVWALGGFDREPADPTAASECLWTPKDATANVHLKDVGEPPETGMPTSGTRPMTIITNQGSPVTVQLDVAAAPCAGASFAHLAGRSFFDGTKCHEITTEGALRCGDPSGTGQGGPTYSFYGENVPEGKPSPSASAAQATGPTPSAGPATEPVYPAGTVALAADPAGSVASQFLIFFKDFTPTGTPSYPIVGKVTSGLDVIKKIGALETVDNGSGARVKPKTDVIIKSLTVGDVGTDPSGASPTPAATTTPSAAGKS